MARRETTSANAIKIINRLLELRPDGERRFETVGWPIGEGCRVWFSLADVSLAKIPFMGLALPELSALQTDLSRRAGMHGFEDVDWTGVPAISWALDGFVPVADPSIFLCLGAGEPPDVEREARVVTVLLEAEQKLVETAGDLRKAVDWLAGVGMRHPTPPWIVPVGYYQLGLRSEGRAYADRCAAEFAKSGPPQLVEFYQRFVRELDALK